MVLSSVTVLASGPRMFNVRRAHCQNGSNLASRKMVRPISPTSRAVETFDGEALYGANALLLLSEDRMSDVIGDGERRIVSRDQQHEGPPSTRPRDQPG
jgi:hypothetical protein